MVALPATVRSPPTVKLPVIWALSAVNPVILANSISAESISAYLRPALSEESFNVLSTSISAESISA